MRHSDLFLHGGLVSERHILFHSRHRPLIIGDAGQCKAAPGRFIPIAMR